MGHRNDFWENLRRTLAPPIGGFIAGLEKMEVDTSEFVGYVEMDVETFEEHLHEMELHRNSLSYWKYFPGLGHENGSWRWVDGDYQGHVILFDGHPSPEIYHTEPRTYIFCHYEYRWDRYPIKHLRGINTSDPKGVNQMRRKLDLASIPYYHDRTIQ